MTETELKVFYGKCYEGIVQNINRYAKEWDKEIVSFYPLSEYKFIVLFREVF